MIRPTASLRRRLMAGAALALPLAVQLWAADARAQVNPIMSAMTTRDLFALFMGSGAATVVTGAVVDVPAGGGPGILGTIVPWSVLNLGTVLAADAAAITMGNGGTVTNAGTAVITGGAYGVLISGGLGTVVNAGSIAATLGVGVYLAAGGLVSNGATGVIAGADGGVLVDGTLGTVLNSGTIIGTETIEGGTRTAAVLLAGGDDILTLDTGSVLVGDAFGGAGTDLLFLNGSGSEDNDFVDFQTIVMRGTNWDLSGTSSFDLASIELGRLGIDGVLASPTVNVAAGGTLGGIGVVVGTVFNSGTVAPGKSIGTLTIDGSFVNGTAGVFQVEVAPSGSGDLLKVVDYLGPVPTGNATLNGGTVDAVTEDGIFTPGQRFTILTTEGTVGGTFAALTTDFVSVFIAPALEYPTAGGSVRQVDLVFRRNGTAFADIADTFNQRSVAGAADRVEALGSAVPADVQALLVQLLNINSAAEANAILDQLSGEAHASNQTVMLRSGERFIATVLSSGAQTGFGFGNLLAAAPGPAPEVAGLGDGALMAAEAGDAARDGGVTLWARPFGVTGDFDSDGNAGGLDFDAAGIAAGASIGIAEGLTVGAAIGYEAIETDFDRFGDSADDDVFQIALHGAFQDGPFHIAGALGYARHAVDASRNLPGDLGAPVPVDADYDADQFLAGIAGGYAIDVGDGVTIEPQAALTFASLDRDGFTEKGASPVLLSVAGETTESLVGRIGARVEGSFDLEGGWSLAPAASLGVAHEFLDEFASIDATLAAVPDAGSFTVRGVEVDPTTIELGLGLVAAAGESLDLFVDYRGSWNADQTEHIAAIGVRLAW